LSEAFHLAALPPAGPVFVSLPLDDWAQQVDGWVRQAASHRGFFH